MDAYSVIFEFVSKEFIGRNGDVTVFQAHTSPVRCVQFSGDSYMLLSTSDDKSIKVRFIHKLEITYPFRSGRRKRQSSTGR